MKSDPNLKKHYPRFKNCSDCNVKSKEVYYSSKFQKPLCLNCLTQNMLRQIRKE